MAPIIGGAGAVVVIGVVGYLAYFKKGCFAPKPD